MTQISIEALEGKTIGELIELSKQAENLPEGFKVTYQKPEIKTAQEIIDEIEKRL